MAADRAHHGAPRPAARSSWRLPRGDIIDRMRVLAVARRGLPVTIALLTGLAFLPSLGNGFVDWDDSRNLLENTAHQGLGWRQLRWAFGTMLLGHYIPLTWLSFSLDYAVWGLNPFGYHLTNLLLHAAAAVLFYAVARRLLAAATTWAPASLDVGAAVAALFFAVHPLRVESVAWITERRDVLSGALFLTTVLLYLRAQETTGSRRHRPYWASVGVYLAALASKSIVMTLPLVLVLLDVYPLRRLRGRPRQWFAPANRGIWLEKTPYLVLSLVAAVVAHYAQVHFAPSPDRWWPTRLVNIFYSLAFYVVKTAVPLGLSPRYEAPSVVDPVEPRFLLSIVGVAVAAAALVLVRRRWPAGLALGLYHAFVLAPVSGVMPLASILVADRYSYLVCLGWAVLVGSGAGALVEAAGRGTTGRFGRSPWAALAGGAVVLWLVALGAVTWRQTQVWHDSERLWRHAVAVTPECTLCRINLGNWLSAHGFFEAALAEFETVLAHRPDRLAAHGNAAWALTKLERYAEAAQHYRKLLADQQDSIAVRSALASVLARGGRRTEAVEVLHHGLVVAGPERAAAFFREGVTWRPTEPVLRLGLAQAYAALGQADLARQQYDTLRALDPALAAAVGNLGSTP